MGPTKIALHPRGAAACPYCHERLATGVRVWRCNRCVTPHHDECAREHGRCTIYGCGAIYKASPAPVAYAAPVRREGGHATVGFVLSIVLGIGAAVTLGYGCPQLGGSLAVVAVLNFVAGLLDHAGAFGDKSAVAGLWWLIVHLPFCLY
jgi:hypothetical protein